MSNFKIDKRQKYIDEKNFIKYCETLKLNITSKDLKKFSENKILYPYYSINENNTIELDFNIYLNEVAHQSVIDNGHPFDVAFQNGDTQIKKNSSSNDKNYYTRWQVFIIYEILTTNLTTYSIKNYSLIKTTNINKFKSKITEFEPYFQTITDYMMIETLLYDKAFKTAKEETGSNIIEGNNLTELNQKISEKCTKYYREYQYGSWIKFIRKLVEIYNNYMNNEKYKLADEIKIFLTNTINLIIGSEEKDFNQICIDFDGKISRGLKMEDGITFRSGGLKKIYPDDIELSIEKFKTTFKSITDEATITKLVDFIQSKELEYIFLYIYDIEKIWFNRERYWERKLWAYMRSLVIGIEFYATDTFSCKLGNLHSQLGFAQTNGDNSISSHLNKLKIGNAESLEEYIEKLNILIEASKRPVDQYKDEYYYHIFYLTRNFFAHNIKIDNTLTGSIFYPIYESLKKVLLKVYKVHIGEQ